MAIAQKNKELKGFCSGPVWMVGPGNQYGDSSSNTIHFMNILLACFRFVRRAMSSSDGGVANLAAMYQDATGSY